MLDAGLAPLRAHAPEAYAALERANALARTAVDPELLEPVRRRVEMLLTGTAPADEEARGKLEHACLELTEHYVTYVPGVTDEITGAVREHLGEDELQTFVEALYVLDQTQRLRLAVGGLFRDESETGEETGAPSGGGPAALHAAVADLHAAAVNLGALDPVTTELVRLRCARHHDCLT